MEKNVLKDYETFNEFSDKFLEVSKTSSYYYIKMEQENFVAKKNIDTISVINLGLDKKIMIINSYYNVKDGSLVLTTKSISNIDGSNKQYIELEDTIEIMSLSSILNIKGNDKYYLTENDVDVLINYENENNKVYTKKPGK